MAFLLTVIPEVLVGLGTGPFTFLGGTGDGIHNLVFAGQALVAVELNPQPQVL